MRNQDFHALIIGQDQDESVCLFPELERRRERESAGASDLSRFVRYCGNRLCCSVAAAITIAIR